MNEVFDFIAIHEDGVTEEALHRHFQSTPRGELTTILATLIQQNKVELQKGGSNVVYKSTQSKNSSYEALVLSLIAQGGTSGLWLKDIKSKTNIPHNLVLKILRVLEETRRIKSIKSVKNNRKTYVLYDVKPDEDVSGGVWFSNNDVDLVFVNKLMEIIYEYVKRPEGEFVLSKIESLVNLRGVKEFIGASGISEVELSIEDINTLIDSLVYDGKVERVEYGGDIYLRVLKDEYMKLY